MDCPLGAYNSHYSASGYGFASGCKTGTSGERKQREGRQSLTGGIHPSFVEQGAEKFPDAWHLHHLFRDDFRGGIGKFKGKMGL